ncbi:copper transporter [Blastococcus saxobsidens]|uniref:Copper transport outer membrane protein MctB n=1 Tax=Blastococcus saxobsidens TaxID=138336 RepID=A0A4Q7Y4R8_9ACTN|nr:copper transporter [Blastococcus saxobsidens]RZU31608.1 copper transport outer membrane protein MctB [Blastococcus saxobsidens]
MIDFRYHLVSLIAVFLAVALGIVIGTTQLNQPILNDIRNQVTDLEQDKRALEDQTQALQTQVDTANSFQDEVAPALVRNSLEGRSVLLVATGEEVGPETIEEVTALVAEAGGSVSGVVRLTPGYTDPSSEAGLQSYVTGSGLPAGIQLPEDGDAGALVAALLAQVLMVPAGGAAPDTAAASSVLAGLVSLDVLSQETAAVAPADFAVVLTSGEIDGEDPERRNAALVQLVTALDTTGSGAVVAGNAASAGDAGLVGAIRADPALAATVSTVDNIGTAVGRISAVLALPREAEGTSGSYGTGQDTQPVPPVPAAP